MHVKVCYLSHQWDKINGIIKGRSITNFIHSEVNKKIASGPCEITNGITISKSFTFSGPTEERIKCMASCMGISPTEYVQRYILDVIIVPEK